MGSIYWNIPEISIPPEGRINHYNNEVSIYYKDGAGSRRRTIIGRAVSQTTMHPNKNFRHYYPDIWNELCGEHKPLPNVVHAGLYAMTLGIGIKTGLYPAMQSCFGPQHANAMMDFAMYTITERHNAASLYEGAMADMMLFSGRLCSDSHLCRLFGREISSEQIDDFKRQWLERCAQSGIDTVWLCIDGSNSDCAMKHSELAEPGHAKSGKNVNIISYIWAVSAADGRPVTWFVNNGGMHDAKAFHQIINFLAASNIKTQGVILDRKFASSSVLELIEKLDLEYVVKLKNGTEGYRYMLEQHASEIRMKMTHALTNSTRGLFGITDHAGIFSNSPKASCIGLFFDCLNGAERSVHLINKIFNEANRLRQDLASGKAGITVKPKLKPFLGIDTTDPENAQACINYGNCQNAIDGKGFSAIASSLEMSAEQMSALYSRRDASEKIFSALKSGLGSGAVRVHSDTSMQARFAVAFIASVIRAEAEIGCRSLGLDTDKIIKKLNRVRICRYPNDQYHPVYDISGELALILGQFLFTPKCLEGFARELNIIAEGGLLSQQRLMPGCAGPENKKQEDDGKAAKPRKRGRPKGSKNKKTLEREKQMQEQGVEPVKRRPGRPKGSKNKKTLEREAAAVKRGRGRPKGSKNKKTLEREAAMAKRGPGRPKKST